MNQQEKSYHIVTTELLIQLLVGKKVRFYAEGYGFKVSTFVGVIDGKKEVYAFNDFSHPASDVFITKAYIMFTDYDWDSIDDEIRKMPFIKIKERFQKYYN